MILDISPELANWHALKEYNSRKTIIKFLDSLTASAAKGEIYQTEDPHFQLEGELVWQVHNTRVLVRFTQKNYGSCRNPKYTVDIQHKHGYHSVNNLVSKKFDSVIKYLVYTLCFKKEPDPTVLDLIAEVISNDKAEAAMRMIDTIEEVMQLQLKRVEQITQEEQEDERR